MYTLYLNNEHGLKKQRAFKKRKLGYFLEVTDSISKVMEQSRRQVVKSIVNVILFVSLFASFLWLYFVNETNEYLKGSTTFASRTEVVDKFDFPVLVICFEPNYKHSIYGNGSSDFTILFDKEELIKEEEMAKEANQEEGKRKKRGIVIAP